MNVAAVIIYSLMAVGLFALGITEIVLAVFTAEFSGWDRLYYLALSVLMFNGSRIFVKWTAEKVK